MKRRLFCTLTGATAVAGAMSGFSRAARAQDALTQMKANGVLRIGTETAFAPFDFIDPSGKHVGFNLDLFAALGKDLGVKVTYTLLPFEGLLPGLEARRFDLVGGPLTITKARMERYRFLPPVSEGTVALLKRRGDSSITAKRWAPAKPRRSSPNCAPSPRHCPARRRSANTSATMKPMPIWPRAASRPWAIHSQT